MEQLYDVVAVEISNPENVQVLDRDKTERNAEAIVSMAVLRRGVETHFYKTVPAGTYSEA